MRFPSAAPLAVALAGFVLPLSVFAQDGAITIGDLASDEPLLLNEARWTGAGELGLAASRGNSSNENLNARLRAAYEDRDWRHGVSLTGLRSSSEITLGPADDPQVVRETTANRYELGISSAIKYDERSFWTSSLRHEHDDFAAYRWQSTFGIGYGRVLMADDDGLFLALEAGPGYRRARNVEDAETETGPIARGFLDFRIPLTANTDLVNTLLVEAGDENTYAQNDLGIQVSMTERIALKAGFQARHNSNVQDGLERTDRLTTMNLVYDFR